MVVFQHLRNLRCAAKTEIIRCKAERSCFKRLQSTSISKDFNFIANAVEETAPAVVNIDILGRSYGNKEHVIGSGSGFVVTDYGIILTNAHVVNQASSLRVKFPSAEHFPGNVLDLDPITDLAVISVNPGQQKLKTAILGNSANIRLGEWVVALGSPMNLSNTVTAGIVSSVHRGGKDIGIQKGDMKYIQTDAAINRGNSGGPLINLDSEVIGINTMTLLNTNGISFAVPIDRAKAFLLQALEKQDLSKSKGSKFQEYRPFIGLKMMTITPALVHQLSHEFTNFSDVSYGVLVVDVVEGSPAAIAGLKPYDVLVEIDGVVLSSTETLSQLVARAREFNATILRGASREKLQLSIKPQLISN